MTTRRKSRPLPRNCASLPLLLLVLLRLPRLSRPLQSRLPPALPKPLLRPANLLFLALALVLALLLPLLLLRVSLMPEGLPKSPQRLLLRLRAQPVLALRALRSELLLPLILMTTLMRIWISAKATLKLKLMIWLLTRVVTTLGTLARAIWMAEMRAIWLWRMRMVNSFSFSSLCSPPMLPLLSRPALVPDSGPVLCCFRCSDRDLGARLPKALSASSAADDDSDNASGSRSAGSAAGAGSAEDSDGDAAMSAFGAGAGSGSGSAAGDEFDEGDAEEEDNDAEDGRGAQVPFRLMWLWDHSVSQRVPDASAACGCDSRPVCL
jgi:hypothetical protein